MNLAVGSIRSLARLSTTHPISFAFSRGMTVDSAQNPAQKQLSWPVTEKSGDLLQPLGPGAYIKTAGLIVIADEVLNGKTLDTNTQHFAKFCFRTGIDLKRVEIIPDDPEEIADAAKRFVAKYDFCLTTGGIGPTEDDRTYKSLATAFDQLPLELHEECNRRLMESVMNRPELARGISEAQQLARQRMARFPNRAEVIFTQPHLWVPVVRLERKLCIFPGIPKLFQSMLAGLEGYLPLPPVSERPIRALLFVNQPESHIAPILEKLHNKGKPSNTRIGSYPKSSMTGGVIVSVISKDAKMIESFSAEIESELGGVRTSQEDLDNEKDVQKSY